MNKWMFLLLTYGRLYTTSMYNIDCTLLTYLLANEIFYYAYEYLPYLPTFLYLIEYSAIVKKEKKKEKRKKKDVVDFAL